MDKIRVYVNSVAPAAVDYVDMKSVEHPCSQAGERAFEGMKNLPPRATTQLRFILKRWKVPVISSGNKIIKGPPTKQQLESLLP